MLLTGEENLQVQCWQVDCLSCQWFDSVSFATGRTSGPQKHRTAVPKDSDV